MTLREFDFLCKRKSMADRRTEYNFAKIVCILANINRAKGKPAYKPEDFCSVDTKKRVMTWQEMKNVVKLTDKQINVKYKIEEERKRKISNKTKEKANTGKTETQ